uniref:uncharacterized protein n=1 Tax=Pristiophorus japonicus TaxID=55135 RepID=UPI00398EC1A9
MIAAVQVKFPYQLGTSPKAVVTQFKNKTSFQDPFENDFVDSIKVTTWSNYSTNVSVTTPLADILCETSLESTTSISSSPGLNQTCSDLLHSLTVSYGNEPHLGAATKVTSLIQRCLGQISNTASIISYLENIFMEKDFEGENKVGETEYIAFYILKINTESFLGVQFPNPDTRNLSTLDPAIKIELPPTLLHNSNNHFNTTTSRISFTIYKNTSLFQPVLIEEHNMCPGGKLYWGKKMGQNYNLHLKIIIKYFGLRIFPGTRYISQSAAHHSIKQVTGTLFARAAGYITFPKDDRE